MNASQQIDKRIASITDWRGKVLATIRKIMLAADPAVTEDWKWMGTPVWYCDGMVSLANPHKDKVKWTFSHGAHYPDVDGLFNAGLDGSEWRAIDFVEKDRLNEPALKRLVATAIAYNREKLQAKAAAKKSAKPKAAAKAKTAAKPKTREKATATARKKPSAKKSPRR